MPASRPVPREASLTGRITSVHILKKSADRLRSLQMAVGHLWQFFCWKHQESVGWTGGLDWWTGLVDWTGGLDWWTGLVDWTGGLDWWTGLVDWTTILCHEPCVYAWGVCIHWTGLDFDLIYFDYMRKVDSELVRSPLFPACLGCFYHSRPLIHYSRFCLTFIFFFLASHTLKQK